MIVDAVRRVAHARAHMLGSSLFPPAAHLAYLEAHGPSVGVGLGPQSVGDLLLRDAALPDEQSELVRVISETLITFGQVGRFLTPAAVNATPARLLAAEMVWFGFERAGRLVGLHGGFFWDERIWVRRFQSILEPGGGPWETLFRIELALYGHLWDLGMRETVLMVPLVEEFLATRRATGWQDAHEVYFAGNARPFMWLRKVFAFRPAMLAPLAADAAWHAET